MARKRLGQLLMERGLIDVDQLNSSLAYHRQWGVRLGAALVAKGFIAEGTLTRVLAESLQIPMVDLAKVVVDKKALGLLKPQVCEQNEVFPIAVKTHKGRHTLLLAMADPLNVAAIDEIAFTTEMTVRPAIAQISSIDAAVRRHYHGQNIDIPPLDFTKKREGKQMEVGSADDDEMTIITGQGTERMVSTSSRLPSEEEINLDVELDKLKADELPSDPLKRAEEEMRREREAAKLAGEPPYMAPVAEPDPFAGAPTGTFVMAPLHEAASMEGGALRAQTPAQGSFSADVIAGVPITVDSVEALEKKFWALMRVLSRRGVVTKDEFLEELSRSE